MTPHCTVTVSAVPMGVTVTGREPCIQTTKVQAWIRLRFDTYLESLSGVGGGGGGFAGASWSAVAEGEPVAAVGSAVSEGDAPDHQDVEGSQL